MTHLLAPGTDVAGYRIESLLGEGATGAVYLARDAERAGGGAEGARPGARRRLAVPRAVPAREPRGRAARASQRRPGARRRRGRRAALHRDGVGRRRRPARPAAPRGPARARAGRRAGRRTSPPASTSRTPPAWSTATSSRRTSSSPATRARLCDFGLARHTASADSLTGERTLVGTVAYIAPEQIEGAGVDARSDVYSLGCVLFECLTGEPPFDRDSELAVLYAHLNEPPPRPARAALSSRRPSTSSWPRRSSKAPAERPASGGELARAARAALRGEAPRRRGRRRSAGGARRGGRWLAGAAAAAVLLSGGADDAPARPPVARSGADVLAAVDARSGRLVSRVRLPGRPDEVAPAGRSTWVLLDGRRRVVRVDARTRSVSAVGPGCRSPAGGIAPGAGGLWVAEAAGPRVALVGGRSGRVERTFRVRPEPSTPVRWRSGRARCGSAAARRCCASTPGPGACGRACRRRSR